MAGNLDTARFRVILSHQLKVPIDKTETFVLGSHGDTMVPIVSKTFIDGRPLRGMMHKDMVDRMIKITKSRGGQIVALLKSGSAYFSPSAACLEILKAVVNDEKKIIPCSCVLDGEYGLADCAIGVPAKIGKEGIEEIVEWELTPEETEALKNSARQMKEMVAL
ncbi:MAG: hypothetical protein A2Z72_03880 [Omnitrophica bacterium RBG_13_46_9]|nr:MAG: hypothetical protein A2Z72_03880 [Omnitrophica bacterium RBG_13_46_9]